MDAGFAIFDIKKYRQKYRNFAKCPAYRGFDMPRWNAQFIASLILILWFLLGTLCTYLELRLTQNFRLFALKLLM